MFYKKSGLKMVRNALKMLRLHNFRGADPHPAGGARTHPRPPSLALLPRALSARHSVSNWFSKVSPTTEKFWFDTMPGTLFSFV